MELESMYQEIILEHYRRPLHAGLREPFDAQVQHVNPTCGDEVTLRVTLNGAGSEPAWPTCRTRRSAARSARRAHR